MNKKKTGTIIFIVIIAITLLCTTFTLVKINSLKSETKITEQKVTSPKQKHTKDFIAALHIKGVIQEKNQTYNQEWLLETITMLKNNKKNKGLALFIDSPGGNVYQADELYLALQDYKTTGKPIYAYQGPIAASGGYYISCAANKIYANRNTLNGSIGVIFGQSIDITELMSKIGIKSTTIFAGKNKNMFNFDQPVTPEQREIMQSIANECYDQFIGIVAINRNIPLFEVKKLADGRLYTAKQSLKLNLIDGIGSWQNMIDDMTTNEFEGNKYKVVTYEYEESESLINYLLGKVTGANPEAIASTINKMNLTYPAYLYE